MGDALEVVTTGVDIEIRCELLDPRSSVKSRLSLIIVAKLWCTFVVFF